MEKLNKESAKLMKVDELKSALKARRCSTSGKKSELYDRLAAYFDAESAEDHGSLVAESSSKATLANESKSEESKTSNSEEDPDSVKVALTSAEEKSVFEEPQNTSSDRINEFANDLQSATVTDDANTIETSLVSGNISTTDKIIAIAESSGSAAVSHTAMRVIIDAEIAAAAENPRRISAPVELAISSINVETIADHKGEYQESKSSSLIQDKGAVPNEPEAMDIVSPEAKSEVCVESLSSDRSSVAVDGEKTNSEDASELTGINGSAVEENQVSITEDNNNGNKGTLKANEEQITSMKRFHVRIDNFQRPLTDRLLFEWLATTLGHEVLKENLWMNKIKTHCYIDFETSELAEACKIAVTGQKVDSKHSSHLVASSTEISASDAENSVEGNLKPSEWKNQKAGAVTSSGGAAHVTPVQTLSQVTRPVSGNAQVSMSTSSIEMVRKAALQSINSSNRMTVSHDVGSERGVSGNEHIGFSTKRNSSAAGITQESSKRQNTGTESGPSSLSQIPNNPTQRESSWRQTPEAQNFTDSVALDKLFRKTEALPPLYWLPVSDDVVAKRSLLGSKS